MAGVRRIAEAQGYIPPPLGEEKGRKESGKKGIRAFSIASGDTTNLEQPIRKDIPPNRADYVSKIIDRFRIGTPEGKNVFLKYYKPEVVNSIQMRTSYFDSDKHKIYIDIDKDINDPRGDCCAYFHEWGHYIDYVTGKEGGQNEHTRLSTADSKFGELLRTDFDNYIQNYMKKNKIIEEETHRQITNDLHAKMNANNQISDLFNMLSGGKINSRFGHDINKLSMDERTM
ncbi:MAG: hypothetical protein LBP19_02385, partial [Treponema sp.]|nr:hypothetical protein [Treponema sp.]